MTEERRKEIYKRKRMKEKNGEVMKRIENEKKEEKHKMKKNWSVERERTVLSRNRDRCKREGEEREENKAG